MGKQATELFAGKRFRAMKTDCLLINAIEASPIRTMFPKCARMAKSASDSSIHYLCLVYDPKSPLRDEHYNVQSRKDAAIAYLSIADERAGELRKLSTDRVVDALQEILKFIDDYRWRSIVQFEELYDSNERQMLVGITSDKDKDRMQAAELAMKLAKYNIEIEGTLRSLWNEYVSGDDDAKEAIRARRPLTPEEVAAWELPDTKKQWMQEIGGDVLQEEQT